MKRIIAFIVLLTLPMMTLRAQIKLIPIQQAQYQKAENKESKSGISAKTDNQPLILPFWEDFSASRTLDPLKWQNSENVLLNDGLTFTPPSLNVASFDGLDANGQPYGSGSVSGLVDSLSSTTINLSGYSFADDIYMSFFYQAGGLGNMPNDGDDSLRLEFLNNQGNWITVWPVAGETIMDGDWHQEIIPISSSQFLHSGFRFRFQSVGNLTGMFDIWNLDYIYINRNRNPTDRSYPDRAINEPLSSFVSNYFVVPYDHYLASQNIEPYFWIRNLVTGVFNQNKAYKYFFNYQIDVTDTLGNTFQFSDSEFVEPLESPIGIGETEQVVIREPLADFGGIDGGDSARVSIEIILDAEDNRPISDAGDYDPSKYAPIDFRINDTLRSTYFLTDLYAYDDGTAEAAAGLNFAADRLAVQFELLPDSGRITAVDMYFPFIGSEPAGKSVDLIIWNDDEGVPGDVLYRQQTTIRREGGLNNFVRYELNRSVKVQGTYYVGYRQNTNGELGLGLDLNTFSGTKMFFNLDIQWEENSLVPGSLMLRPVFGKVDDVIVGNDPLISEELQLWPNPSTDGNFYLRGNVHSWTVMDITGKSMKSGNVTPGLGDPVLVDLSTFRSGLYILQVRLSNGQYQSLKIFRK
ncbi:T9SS type A sorting domain-containing protein [Fulvivirga sedimenti]|uniref:T9SS type A sorting domain-containing protein n=1 Tax=Fulvivirga sedimenti TaxID=2879465 RepID=A0A9X1HN31_9BACT|nr:T9SS type A sorting domain-containing protein [Fulvivirga sedimenti]MCA6074886.1 T9SS type A sorting domain-containing protein [Fulvivirga sedimenti]MCA6076063.1 T9SS type A sorting domain-containing protein [Fulvivirga sedimenti]MCA6077191.1 T9SS type A sorting domain-containing protein [Fulvivirga sedimenti]